MNVHPLRRCANRTCTRRAADVYCSSRCHSAELAGDGRTPIEGVRVGMDEYRKLVELAAEYGATVQDVIHLLIETEFGDT